MAETAEQQRARLNRKRIAETEEKLIPCLECNLTFKRVGSHVVQVHGYESVVEYRQAYGLMAKETRLDSYADKMRKKARNYENLARGVKTRFAKNDNHDKRLEAFWRKRKLYKKYEVIEKPLNNR